MLRVKAYSDTLKKHLYGILDYAEGEFFYPNILEATCEHCPYNQVGSNSLQMVQSHASGLGTSVYLRTGAPLGCVQSSIHSLTGEKKKGPVGPGCDVPDIPIGPGPA